MFGKTTVPVPEAKGKIVLQRQKKQECVYVLYEYDRVYDKQKQYNVPKRACVGKLDSSDEKRMFPNENYYRFFSSPLGERSLFSDGRSSCVKVGLFLVVRRIWSDLLGIEDFLVDKLGFDGAGVFLDYAAGLVVGEDYASYAWNHPLFFSGRAYSDRVCEKVVNADADLYSEFISWWNSRGRNGKKRVNVFFDSDSLSAVAFDNGTGLPLFREGNCSPDDQALLALRAEGYGYGDVCFVMESSSSAVMEECKRPWIVFGDRYDGKLFIKCEIGGFEKDKAHYISRHDVHGKSYKDEDGRWVHLFFSDERRSREASRFFSDVYSLEEQLKLMMGKVVPKSSLVSHKRWFDLEFSSEGNLVGYKPKASVINKEAGSFGYSWAVSSGRMEAGEVLDLLSVSKVGVDASQLFGRFRPECSKLMEFLALIAMCEIHRRVEERVRGLGRRRDYMTLDGVVAELEKIEMVRAGDGVYRLDHVITPRQLELLSLFDMDESTLRQECKRLSGVLVSSPSSWSRVSPSAWKDDSSVEDELERSRSPLE